MYIHSQQSALYAFFHFLLLLIVEKGFYLYFVENIFLSFAKQKIKLKLYLSFFVWKTLNILSNIFRNPDFII